MEPSKVSAVALMAGGCAGTATDVCLFPLDTIKTRMQSASGFRAAGGFTRLYAGLGPAALASAPSASLFFCTYEMMKRTVGSHINNQPLTQMLAASTGEAVACIVRVPTEIVKQRKQALQHSSSFHIIRNTLQKEGVRGLFRGYTTTLFREIPFSLIQFPIWEKLKVIWSESQGSVVSSWQAAVCGAVAGGFSAAVTTPLDVAKTRIMLADANSSLASGKLNVAIRSIYQKHGVRGLFYGVAPRTIWMSLGGFIFLGVYDKASSVISKALAKEEMR